MKFGDYLPEEVEKTTPKKEEVDVIKKEIDISSDEARTAFFLLTKKQSRTSTIKCLKDIKNYLDEVL